ncbi:MAG: beta-L-arabinofuranosidase domain-containing protein, partial [Tepidisphaeraceae bacterium]
NPKYKATAENFWAFVTQQRSFVTGSNSDREHFFPLGLESKKLGPENGESCNVYNMLKLTAHLASWDANAGDYDYYERALFNHILGSIDPNTGMCTYFQSLEPGRFKVYGDPTQSVWCCTGTGLENHAKYGEHIYAHDGADTLFVNLFIASELNWKEQGLTLRQETKFPDSDTTSLTLHLAKPARLAIKLRIPGWAKDGISVTGAVTAHGDAGAGYLTVDREWKDGDTITVRMPMALRLHRAIDDPTMVAVVKGPIVLAAELGRQDFPATDNVADHTVYDHLPVPHVPTIVTDDASLSWLKPVADQPMHYTAADVGPASGLEFVPFYSIAHQRYAVYLRMVNAQEYAKIQQQQAAREAAKRALDARTVDEVIFGEQQPEEDHAVKSDQSHTGRFNNRSWRDAVNGGWFSADLKTKPGVPSVLRVTYWGSDAGNRVFDIVADGKVIATQTLTAAHREQFFDVDYDLPATDKPTITLRFAAHPGATAGGVFGCRLMTQPAQPELLKDAKSPGK